MLMNLDAIRQTLYPYRPTMILRGKEPLIINTATLLAKNLKQLEPDILYIGEVSDLPLTSEINSPVNFLICLNDTPIPEEYKILEQVNWLMVERPTEPSELLHKIRELLKNQTLILHHSTVLYNAAISGKGLQAIIDSAYGVFGNPLYVADVSFKVLAFTKNSPILDSFWQKEIVQGYLCYDSVKSAKREGIISKVYQSEDPVILNLSFTQRHRLSNRITIDGEIAGFISILEYERPFEESDIELARTLCSILSHELKKDRFLKYTRGIMHDTLIFDLLNENKMSQKVLDSRLRYLNLKLSKHQYILNVKYLEECPDNLPFPYLRMVLESIVSRCMGVIFDDTIVLLITRDTKRPLSKCESDSLSIFFRENRMVGGLSLSFQKISDIRNNYLQASTAIALGTRLGQSKSIYCYSDYAFYHLLSTVADQIDIKKFCSPLLIELLEYDRQNKTRFVESLYVYLFNGCNAVESARIFKIHRNSMDYRIRKIEELLDIKINEPANIFALTLSFKILFLIGEKDCIDQDLLFLE